MLEKFQHNKKSKPANNPAKSRHELEARLIARAWTDPEFKARLLSNPRQAVGEELGSDLPPGLEVRAVEETPQKLYLLVPVRPEGAESCSLETLQAQAAGDNLNPFTKSMPPVE